MRNCIIHCHSEYSRDSRLSLDRIIHACEQQGITTIALTDHNEIAGAQRLQQMAPDWLNVIVGEEVSTQQGDLLALFLQSRIPAGLSVDATIEAIHAQGGLAVLPHPFDRLRREAMGAEESERIAALIDAVETFNSRCIFPLDNTRALEFARRHEIVGIAAADAHTRLEYRSATMQIEDWETPAEFLANLRRAQSRLRYASTLVHVQTVWDKRIKKRTQIT